MPGLPVQNLGKSRREGMDFEAKLDVVRDEKAGGEVLSVSRGVTPSATPAMADADTYGATLSFTLETPRTN